MALTTLLKYQYYSKWRLEWVDCKRAPNEMEMADYKKYHYKIRIKP